eukprot:TRINITY_DN11289_c0_g1_i1.p1 TRINITY_DN11289_c0_g1~~TRINITY_DN11289_c0_g1_i1.p1  ORF type:complete len:382 (+),score=59.54 TRINITY_DN11289_c0_g1_i1:126-1148(+)
MSDVGIYFLTALSGNPMWRVRGQECIEVRRDSPSLRLAMGDRLFLFTGASDGTPDGPGSRGSLYWTFRGPSKLSSVDLSGQQHVAARMTTSPSPAADCNQQIPNAVISVKSLPAAAAVAAVATETASVSSPARPAAVQESGYPVPFGSSSPCNQSRMVFDETIVESLRQKAEILPRISGPPKLYPGSALTSAAFVMSPTSRRLTFSQKSVGQSSTKALHLRTTDQPTAEMTSIFSPLTKSSSSVRIVATSGAITPQAVPSSTTVLSPVGTFCMAGVPVPSPTSPKVAVVPSPISPKVVSVLSSTSPRVVSVQLRPSLSSPTSPAVQLRPSLSSPSLPALL